MIELPFGTLFVSFANNSNSRASSSGSGASESELYADLKCVPPESTCRLIAPRVAVTRSEGYRPSRSLPRELRPRPERGDFRLEHDVLAGILFRKDCREPRDGDRGEIHACREEPTTAA